MIDVSQYQFNKGKLFLFKINDFLRTNNFPVINMALFFYDNKYAYNKLNEIKIFSQIGSEVFYLFKIIGIDKKRKKYIPMPELKELLIKTIPDIKNIDRDKITESVDFLDLYKIYRSIYNESKYKEIIKKSLIWYNDKLVGFLFKIEYL